MSPDSSAPHQPVGPQADEASSTEAHPPARPAHLSDETQAAKADPATSPFAPPSPDFDDDDAFGIPF